jgi:hypothetical protein
MGFDVSKFAKTKFNPRTKQIPVPNLREFFTLGEGEEPVFTVRNLEGEELARVREYQREYMNLGKLIEGLLAGDQKEKVKAIKESYGMTEKVPGDFARRLKLLTVGSVDPVITQDISVRLAKYYPAEFYDLTNNIDLLNDHGALPGE